ncbi:MAG: glycoside hydrolase family 13 [Kineosporiaceae bacterium]|nr:glycoside hydrolase family 13 [Kineosporiaceae bacterium]
MHKHRLDDGSVLVAFELPAAVAADSVSLVGDFNDWSPAANPLARQDDGYFRTELRLPAGQRARFRYLLDGRRWENDWAADDYVPNGLGADDSVVDLTDVASIEPLVTPAPQPEVLAELEADAEAEVTEPEVTEAPSVVAVVALLHPTVNTVLAEAPPYTST